MRRIIADAAGVANRTCGALPPQAAVPVLLG